MNSLVIPDLDQTALARLQERALAHGRSPEAEARTILVEVLQAGAAEAWTLADAFRERLQASGRVFSDSAELIREDRDR